MNKKLLISLALILFIGIVLVGYWYYKGQSFSKGILKLEILGPDSSQMGQEIEYTVRYKNNSDFTLEEPKLTFEFPEYSVGEDGKNRTIKTLEDIYPGDEQFVKFKTRLLGKEDDLKVAKAYLSYKPKNLSTRYESDTTIITKINLVPLTLDFDLPSKIETNKEIQFSLNYFSNIDYLFQNLKLNIEYPKGFDFSESDPKTLEKTEWEIPSLEKAQGGRITITGKITARSGENLSFGAKLGIWQNGEFILLKEASKEIQVIEPLLYISQQVNGSSDYVASPGETLHYEIYFRNIGNTPFDHLYLINKLDSPAFDLSTIKVNLGQASVNNNLVIWDWKQISSLLNLGVQEEGKVEFDVNLKNEWLFSNEDLNKTSVKNIVNVSDISQEFQTKVNSKLVVLQTGLYQDNGIFGNSGPVPPVAGQATTYTVNWQVENLYNDVKNVKVRATLPQGVSLTGRVSPDSEISKFSFDSTSREIVWTVGDTLLSGTGVPSAVSFQISLTPTSSQAGRVITLINPPKITGEDQWTSRNIEWTGQALDTTLSISQAPSIPSNQGEEE
jgi:hypothetical protein